MAFSKEEKQIWENSETMQELEKIAKEEELFEFPESVDIPEEDDVFWEDELNNEEKLIDAAEEILIEDTDELDNELESKFYEKHSSLVKGLQKLAHYLAENGKFVAAHKIEDTILDINIALKEMNDGSN